jgi:hypothetical protein
VPKEGAREDGTFYVISQAPDVCKTPMGAIMTPVPYPIIGKLSDVAGVATTVRMRGKPTFTTTSQVTRVQGDEAGTGGGVASGVNMSICESITASTTVQAEGHHVLRDGDLMKMNNGNTIGKIVYLPGAPSGSSGPEGAIDQVEDDFVSDVKGFFTGLPKRLAKKVVMGGPVGELLWDGPPVPNPDAIYQHLRDAKAKGGWWRVGGAVVYMGVKYVVIAKGGELMLEELGPTAGGEPGADPNPADSVEDAAPPEDPDANDTVREPAETQTGMFKRFGRRPAKATSAGNGLTVTGAADTQRMAIAILGDGDPVLQTVRYIEPEPGFQDIVIHADQNGFWKLDNGRWVPVSVSEVADIVRSHGPPPPNGYRLVACEAGADVHGPAQQLSKQVGAPVWAADKPVESPTLRSGKLSPDRKSINSDSGRFRHFQPNGESPFIPDPTKDPSASTTVPGG